MSNDGSSKPTVSKKHMPDWEHYKKNKDRIDEYAKRVLEEGTLQAFGHPPGPTLDISAKALCCILDKHPELATEGVNPMTGKPLSASEKRKQKRFKRDREPDGVINYDMVPDKDFKIIPNEEYVPPPSAQYVKGDGTVMEPGWEPIAFKGQTVGNGEVEKNPAANTNQCNSSSTTPTAEELPASPSASKEQS